MPVSEYQDELGYRNDPADDDRRAKLKKSIDVTSEEYESLEKLIQNWDESKSRKKLAAHLASQTSELLRQHDNAAAAHRRLQYLERKGLLNRLRSIDWQGTIDIMIPRLVINAGIFIVLFAVLSALGIISINFENLANFSWLDFIKP